MAAWKLKSVFSPLPKTERATAVVINGDPKGNNFLYTNGKTVVIRDINNPGLADTYTQHSCQATVAQYAPSGYYIASADVSGKIRIWDTVNKEHILKYEYQPFSGCVKDLCWSPDSKRIVVGGQGNEIFCACILWDTGSSVGNLSGHRKAINSVTYKPTRPFRIATASEDFTCCFFEGPPFKFTHAMKDHTRFVNCIRYSTDGNTICSGGSDGIANLYDGKTGTKIGSLGGDKAHSGGIYSVAWSPDSCSILTASGDKSCKLWDVATQQVVSEFKMGSATEDQQLGCLWQNDWILSVSLSGNINYLDKNDPNKPLRILTGQNRNLSSLATTIDSSTVYCGSMDGKISYWSVDNGTVDLVNGVGHTNLVCSLLATSDTLYTLGFDKTMRKVSIDTHEFLSDVFTLSDRDPVAFDKSFDNNFVIASKTDLTLVRDGKKISCLSVPYVPLSVCFQPNKPLVAIGGQDGKVHLYNIEGDAFNETNTFVARGEVNTLSYDSTGTKLAVSGSGRYVEVFDTETYQLAYNFIKQTARVNALAWSPNGNFIASGGVDSNVCIYNIETKDIHEIKGAHPMDVVTDLSWINDNTLATCGNDVVIRIWQL